MRVKEILKSKGMSVGELANRLGVSRQALSKQIQGKLLVETAERIASVLEVPIWQLFVSEDEILQQHGLRPQGFLPDFMAVFKNGADTYWASSISEAKDILDRLDKNK